MKLHERGTQEELGKLEGLCFSYLFGTIIIITSVLHQWPKSLVPEVMGSGLNLFQNPTFVDLNSQYCPGSIYPSSHGQTSSLPSAMSSMQKTMLWSIGVEGSFWIGY